MNSDPCSDSDSENNSEIREELSDDNSSSDVENPYLSAEQLEKICAYEEPIESEENSTNNIGDTQVNVEQHTIPEPVRKIYKILEFIDDKLIKYQLLRPLYQDVTPSFADEVPFLVDGDSLLITIMMDKNWSNQLGGSTLHLVYLFERYLNIFVQRGGTFHLVFFQNWRNIWHKNWNMLLYRLVLINHFSRNTEKYPVHLFDHCFDENFISLVNTIRPGFILTNMDAYEHCSEFFNIKKCLLKHVMNINLLCWLKMDLPCIDTNFIEVNVSIVKGFYLDCNPDVREIINMHLNKFKCFITTLPNIEEYMEPSNYINISEDKDIRTATFLAAAFFFYKRNHDENMVKIFLLTATMMEFLDLKNRCCPKFTTPMVEFEMIIAEWHKCMFFALSVLKKEKFNSSTVCDMWQGILFGHVCRFTSSVIDCSEKLGSEVGSSYEKLIYDFNKFGDSISAYPIALTNININFETIDSHTVSQTDPKPLIPIQNTLVLKFCSNILHDIKWCKPPKCLFEKIYTEEHHYHSMKIISDEHDRIKDSMKTKPLDKRELKRYTNQRNLQAKYMTLYGSSIEGRSLETRAIIRNSNSKKEKKQISGKKSRQITNGQNKITDQKMKAKEDTKNLNNKTDKQKSVNKAQQIIDANKEKKMVEQEKKDKVQFDELKAQYNKLDVDLIKLLGHVNLVLMNKSFSQGSYKIDALFLKLKIMLSILKNNIIKKIEDKKENEKSIFLTTKEILYFGCDLSLKRQELLAKSLCSINCSEIAKRNNLPIQKEPNPEDDAWIRFQLTELGPELTRETGGKPDPRVTGFIPDPWQSELFDIVDNRQSALIVAPTSSGKTYASYYCMESVLREGVDGVVVYVAPTKALVNQVAATVYARFKDTKMPDGKSVYGVFTRDYRMYALESQILVTVPQCLEVLLLSPRRYSWIKNLRYVIFDEIHCIEGELGGASFERCLLLIRCPFLALSATIRNPKGLHEWLKRAENYKHDRDMEDGFLREENSYKIHLVEHSERHSDLTKFNYGSEQLHHLHPYADLEESVMRQHQGIPSHMTLSPAETMQLYDAMCTVYSESEKLRQLSPAVFFSSHSENGFISRNVVRKYTSELSALLEDWFKYHREYFKDTIRILRPEINDQIDGTGNTYIIRNIAKLILHLKEQNMLPALVFAYNRSLIVKMMTELTKYLENHKEISSSKTKRIAPTHKENKPVLKPIVDRLETKKYKKKGLNSFSGNAEDTLEDISGKMSYIDKKNMPRFPTRYERYEKPLNLISDDAEQTLQGIGVMTSEDMVYIEQRLRKSNISSKHPIARAMRNGICMHHGGLNNKIRGAVEMLFRQKFLNVVFATGTLALGIHMPCKTTVIAGNSAFLNSLEYHQMSGRAGRRGYDTAGNVIFLGLNSRKQHTLLTAKLPYLKGNFPVTVTLILRTLLLVSDVTDKGNKSEEATKICISRVMTMLENSLCYMDNSDLKINIKHFFSFTLQLLKIQDFINDNGEPLKWCGLATHLHYHEPGNLAFVYLLRSGAIRKLCSETKNDVDIQQKLLVVLSYLFTRVPLDAASKNEFKNSKVVLDPLPEIILEALEQYNKQVHFVFNQYFVNVGNHFNEPDNILPLSSVSITGTDSVGNNSTEENLQNKFLNMCVPKLVCSSFAALSGNNDDNAYTEDTLISNLKQKMATDVKVIPLVNLNAELNGYAVDFYRHGIVQSIREDNGIKAGAEFTLLTDFLLVLKTIRVSLEEMEVINEDDIVFRNFKQLEENYCYIHAEAFGKDHL